MILDSRVLLDFYFLWFDTCIKVALSVRAQNDLHFRVSSSYVHELDHANLVDKQFDDTKSSRSEVFRVHPVVVLRHGAVVALVRARRRMSMVHAS